MLSGTPYDFSNYYGSHLICKYRCKYHTQFFPPEIDNQLDNCEPAQESRCQRKLSRDTTKHKDEEERFLDVGKRENCDMFSCVVLILQFPIQTEQSHQ